MAKGLGRSLKRGVGMTDKELMQMALDGDTENKVKTWCFGHYHNPIDQHQNGIRYVNNCRGRVEDSSVWTPPYYPKRIVVDV